MRTPLVPLNCPSPARIFLKLENLQPIGSFKVRGAANAIASAERGQLAEGVWTASAGNMAQGLAWNARRLGLSCTAVVPEHAPQTKLDAISRLSAKIVKIPFDAWWQILITHRFEGMKGLFVHPASNPAVIAGNGTIGLEILDELPDVETIVVPYGGGGLSVGVAAAIRALSPAVKIHPAEVETAAPLAASWGRAEPQAAPYTPTFVDGIGGKSVLQDVWPLATALLNVPIVVSLRAIADAIRLLVERNRVIAEGAGAASVAAALSGKAGSGKVVCVVSGGNLDTSKLVTILNGEIP
jgi:threonine dehydratase